MVAKFLNSLSTYISSVGNSTSRLVRLNRTKGVILRRGALLGQEVEETRLAHVGQADAAHLEVLADPAKRHDIVLDNFNLFRRHGDELIFFFDELNVLDQHTRMKFLPENFPLREL